MMYMLSYDTEERALAGFGFSPDSPTTSVKYRHIVRDEIL
jgi:hypothetical protein